MLIAAILLCAAITFALRFLPLQVAGEFQNKETVKGMSALLPAGLMLILVAYTFIEAESTGQGLRLAIGVAIALCAEFVTRNIFLSFVLGIISYSLTSLVL